MSEELTEYRIDDFLSAAECNAQQQMSLPLLVQRLLDIATAHAAALGVGYEHLLENNHAWVLSRFSIELQRFPSINKPYSLITWVEDVNRRYSERIVEVRDADDEPIGYGRLVWVAIDMQTRRPADLSPYVDKITPSSNRCPIARFPRLGLLNEPDSSMSYRFRYSDIDFNRHVNSTRYIQLMLDRWSVDFFDRHRVARFDISYHAEALFDDEVEVRSKDDNLTHDVEIVHDGTVYTRARIIFVPHDAEVTDVWC